MKKIFFFLLLTGSLLAIKAVSKNLTRSAFPNAGSKAIVSVDSFEIKINSEDHPQIVDTRLQEEFAINHLINAININSLEKNYAGQISKLDKTKPVFAYAIGNGRSVELANELITKGFASVYVLNGGIGGWIGNGKPIDSSSKDNFSLDDLKAITASNKVVLLDLHTRYCPGCRKLQPTVDSLSKEYGSTLKIVKVDVYDNPKIAGSFKINSIPTLVVYNNGNIVWQRAGADTHASDVEDVLSNLAAK